MQSRQHSSVSTRDSLTSFAPAAVRQLPSFPEPRSKSFGLLLQQLHRYAGDDHISIVLEGESGSGKNWLARQVHQHSRRGTRELHEISLASLTESLATSELFGHEPGAFTDARARRAGAFQSANHSTLFIDEVGKATQNVQRLLLCAIEEKVLRPVGADRPIKVDVRLLFATNVSLKELVAQQLFLPDLYARLGQFRLHVPALRERPEDIPDLALYFLAHHAQRRDYPPGLPTIHPSLMSALQNAEWEYNLRELDGVMHRLLADADPGAELTLDHCTGDLDYLRGRSRGRPTKSSPESVMATVARADSITDAARALQVSRSTIYRKLAEATRNESLRPVAE